MCRAEIFTEDCNKVEQTLATVTHRRQVDFKKRKKEKDSILDFSKNASHNAMCERRFFYPNF